MVGHDGKDDFLEPNISENIIAEKNLSNEPWEFGYAGGASRPLSLAVSAHNCTFCGEKFQAGVECTVAWATAIVLERIKPATILVP